MSKKYVYFFGNGKAEGNAKMKDILGGKGANLAEMTNLGVPVPPGFTISAEICDYYYKHDKTYPPELKEQVEENIKKLEDAIGMRFGDNENPLLVSVRSGAAISMPGMMDTILNLGLTDVAVEGLARKTNNPRFAWDAYRRFIQMFGDVAMGVPHDAFEEILDSKKKEVGVTSDAELDAEALKDIVAKYKEVYKKYTGTDFPQDPKNQLWRAIDAVFGSWNNPRAIAYRELNDIKGLLGTAVNVQAMVFGNMGDHSATGVCFSRDPATGEKRFYGEYLINAQGEDVVAGIRTPMQITKADSIAWAQAHGVSEEERKSKYPSLEEYMPEVYRQLVDIKDRLEQHYKDMQDMEFTIQEGKLFLLQTRTGKRTAQAAVRIAVDMVKEGLIDKKTAIMRVTPEQLDQLLHPTFDLNDKAKAQQIAKGINASPGAAVGKAVFDAKTAEEWAANGEKVILVRIETSPEDIKGMAAAQGILTARGGATSHAAVVGRGMGKPAVVGCGALEIDYARKQMKVGDVVVKEGDYISIDGTTGEVLLGAVKTVQPELSGYFGEFIAWADELAKLKVRTNADTPKDAAQARKFGAVGIGLCRTEHMFFGGNRILAMREMILADDLEGREKALSKLLPMQREDFIGIFEAMDGFPVIIRLLDPPLHEFLPHTDAEIEELASITGKTKEEIRRRAEELHEFNPMLGFRGCRLGIVYPEIYRMQVRAIVEAAVAVAKKGVKVMPEIMFPLIGNVKELKIVKRDAEEVIKEVLADAGIELHIMLGTMIEVPRAAITADEIATEADFFSFGTNDLTQMGAGFSRDDAGVFLKHYVEKGIYDKNPFQSLDQAGIGRLIQIAVEGGRKTKPNLEIGICGEHGGDPDSIDFCHRVGMDYVSCSPFRVPIARLAAAQAAIRNS